MTAPRILIFGGSFDPVHHGHLFIAELAAQHIKAERVIFLPTHRAPHRAPLTASVEHRLAMLRVAIAANPRFALDESDVDRAATGYTVDVLPRVHARYPDLQLSFLVGEDALTKSRWHRFDDVVAQVEYLLVAPRDSDDGIQGQALAELCSTLEPQTRDRIVVLPSPRITISATAIRRRIALGQTIRYLVPDGVRRHIHVNGLYTEDYEMKERERVDFP